MVAAAILNTGSYKHVARFMIDQINVNFASQLGVCIKTKGHSNHLAAAACHNAGFLGRLCTVTL